MVRRRAVNPSQTNSEGIYNGIRTKLPTRDKVTGASEKVSEAAAEFGKLIIEILERAIMVYGDDRNIIFSVISTIMDAVNNSVMGGLTGLESELEKIVNEEKAKGSGKPNAALDFLADCANFIRFFLEYLYYNKKLKIQKHLIKKMAEAKAEKKAAQAKVDNLPKSDATKEAAVAAADKKIKDLLEQQQEAKGKASIRADTEQNDVLTEHNKRIEYLNNAFKHLVFTYGQLSGRTIYNIIQFLQNGPPAKVGYFDPISFGSLTNTMIRASPPGAIAGQIMDSVVDFGKAFINAGEASYVSLEKDRELANEYMAYITEDTNNQISGQSGGKPKPSVEPKKIDRDTFIKYYDSVKEKKDKKGANKDYKKRIQGLTRNKGRTDTNHNISQLTTANIEKRIKDVTNAMTELNHVDNLKALLKQILEWSLLSKKRSIYLKSSSSDTKDNSKIPLLTQEEVSKMRSNPDVKKVFKKIIENFDTKIDSPDKDELDKLTIEKSNPQLYGIIMNFIRNNYKSAEDQVEELEKRIAKLETSSESTSKLYTNEREKEKEKDKGDKKKLEALLPLLKVVAEKEKVVAVYEAILAVVKGADAAAAAKTAAEEANNKNSQTPTSLENAQAANNYISGSLLWAARNYLTPWRSSSSRKKYERADIKKINAKADAKAQTRDGRVAKMTDDENNKKGAYERDAKRSSLEMAVERLNTAALTLMEAVDEIKNMRVKDFVFTQAFKNDVENIMNNQIIPKEEVAKQKLDTAKKELEKAKKAAMDKAGGKKSVDDINNKLLELVALMELDADVIPKLRTKRGWVGRMMKGNKTDKEDAKSEFRVLNAKIIDGENTDNEDANDEQKLAYITREIAKLTESVVAENKRIKELGDRMKGTKRLMGMGKKKPKEGKAFLEEEYKLLLDQLNKVKEAERGELNSEIHNSGDFGRLASTYVKLKRGMAADINGLINNIKADSIQEKDQENLEIVKSGLKKMLEFIRNREFGSINALFKRQKGGGNKTRRGGGDLSNIRRHIAKATRRIETTLSNFNNTRRNKRIKSKPRKTRRVNYGH